MLWLPAWLMYDEPREDEQEEQRGREDVDELAAVKGCKGRHRSWRARRRACMEDKGRVGAIEV